MKLLNAIIIIIISIFLFITMFISFQYLILSQTIYKTIYIQNLMDKYNLTTILGEEAPSTISSNISNFLDQISHSLANPIAVILIALIIGLPIIYLFIRDIDISASIHFFALTGILVTLFNLIISGVFYWFIPINSWINPISHLDINISETISSFLEYSLSHIIITEIKLSLIVLVFFLSIFILTEIKSQLYPTKEKIISHKMYLIHAFIVAGISIFLVILTLVQLSVIKTSTHINQDVLNHFKSLLLDLS